MKKFGTKYGGILWVILGLHAQLQLSGQENMLCQGHYWSEDEANLQMKEFRKSWWDRDSWESHAGQIRKGILEGMHWDRMPVGEADFDPLVRNTREMDGYIVENIAIESFPGFFITGNLYRPLKAEGKQAAVLSPHGHGRNPRFSESVQKRCAVLARKGAVVFAYDMIGHGESVQVDHKMPIALLLQTYNSTRVLDYLLSRPDVDPEQVGISGASGGATQSFMLTAIDERIRVSAPVVQVSAHFFGGCVCESGMPIHRSMLHQTNNVEIAALCAPRPMLLVSDGGDWTHNTPIIEFPYIRDVYALYDAEHRVANVHLPTEGHDYGYSKRAAVYHFFTHHLGLRGHVPYQDGFKEDFVEILSPDQLKVFSDDKPLPDRALLGNSAVMEYLGFNDF